MVDEHREATHLEGQVATEENAIRHPEQGPGLSISPGPRMKHPRQSLEALWARFTEQAARKGTSFAPVPSETTLWFGTRAPRRFVYLAKHALFWHMERQNLTPRDWLVVVRSWFPNREFLIAARAMAKCFRLPIIFVGDLRPMDLTFFAAMRMGSASFSRRNRVPLPIRYAGIDDRWLAIADEFRLPGVQQLDCPMDSFEREHYDVLKKLVPDLEQTVGERCFALLESGKVFMIEMTWAGGGYKEGYLERLIDHLRAVG